MPRLVGPGAIGLAGYASDVFTTPFPHKPGDISRDKDGNEFVFVEFITTNVAAGNLCSINSIYQAAPLLGTARVGSRVGVVMTGSTQGTNGGWVQIYGLHLAVQSGNDTDSDGGSAYRVSDQSVDYVLIPQTSVTTPSGTLGFVIAEANTSVEASTNYRPILGMWLVPSGEVSAIPDAAIIDQWSLVTSPVSAVSNTSGAVTLIAGTTNGVSMHTGTTYMVYLNYPYYPGLDVEFPLVNATS